ncbi:MULTISPECIES: hypothetical protein [unclassified Desulfovibrio]|uniref:hypothetical protein n=1 Tax=unclassified Desulfovibrio TaxID=2593640 RepID=UPI002FDB5C8B
MDNVEILEVLIHGFFLLCCPCGRGGSSGLFLGGGSVGREQIVLFAVSQGLAGSHCFNGGKFGILRGFKLGAGGLMFFA